MTEKLNQTVAVPRWMVSVVVMLLASSLGLMGIIYTNMSNSLRDNQKLIQDMRVEYAAKVASLDTEVKGHRHEQDKIIESIRGLDGQIDKLQMRFR